jgi:hypothetical protein
MMYFALDVIRIVTNLGRHCVRVHEVTAAQVVAAGHAIGSWPGVDSDDLGRA